MIKVMKHKYKDIDIEVRERVKDQISKFTYREIRCVMIKLGDSWVGIYFIKEEAYYVRRSVFTKEECIDLICATVDEYYEKEQK